MRCVRVVSVVTATLTASLVVSSVDAQQPDVAQHVMNDLGVSSAFVQQVREATQPFLDVRQTGNAQYEPFLGCVSGPQEGAMGVHFVNLGLVMDGELDANRPEALIYEPKDGGYRLVGVEYIVPAADWHANNPLPPVLGGQTFQFNDSPNRYGLPPFYELHVWAWRENPNGAFVDWNTHVSCER